MVEVGFDARTDSVAAEEGEECQRFDVAVLASPTRTREGFLRAQAVLTRSGVFAYPEYGSAELRHPDEIFAPESMGSFALLPVTANHPPRMLTPEIVRDYQIGSVGAPERVGAVMRADVLITDPVAIEAIMSGKNRISLGYTSKVVKRSGVYTDDEGKDHRYDSVQTQIRGNHLAIITKAQDTPRAGDLAQIRIDATKRGKTMKIKLAGFEFDVADDVGAEVQKRVDAVTAELSTVQGQVAVLKSEVSKVTADSEAQARLDAEAGALESRMQLILTAQPVLEKPVAELARMDALSIMTAIVAKEKPDVKLAGRDEAFVKGAFEIVMADLSKRVDTTVKLRESQNSGDIQPRTDAKSKIDEAYARMNKRSEDAWKPKTASNS